MCPLSLLSTMFQKRRISFACIFAHICESVMSALFIIGLDSSYSQSQVYTNKDNGHVKSSGFYFKFT